MNIWSPIIDPAQHSVIQRSIWYMGKVQYEHGIQWSKEWCKLWSELKGDGIFRLRGSRLEYRAIEAGRKWEGKNGRKYLNDSFKLGRICWCDWWLNATMMNKSLGNCRLFMLDITQCQSISAPHYRCSKGIYLPNSTSWLPQSFQSYVILTLLDDVFLSNFR